MPYYTNPKQFDGATELLLENWTVAVIQNHGSPVVRITCRGCHRKMGYHFTRAKKHAEECEGLVKEQSTPNTTSDTKTGTNQVTRKPRTQQPMTQSPLLGETSSSTSLIENAWFPSEIRNPSIPLPTLSLHTLPATSDAADVMCTMLVEEMEQLRVKRFMWDWPLCNQLVRSWGVYYSLFEAWTKRVDSYVDHLIKEGLNAKAEELARRLAQNRIVAHPGEFKIVYHVGFGKETVYLKFIGEDQQGSASQFISSSTDTPDCDGTGREGIDSNPSS